MVESSYYNRALQGFVGPRQSSVYARPASTVGGDPRRQYAENQVTGGYIGVVAGALTQAMSGYYQALARKYELRSQAMSLDYESSVEGLNARAAEQDASAALEAGQRNAGLRLLESGQEKGTARAQTAARGVLMSGSAAEQVASIDFAGLVDAQTIRRDSLRQAGNARIAAANARARSGAARVSAANLRATARSIRPGDEFASALFQTAGSAAATYYSPRR